jgi:hypothetical protein
MHQDAGNTIGSYGRKILWRISETVQINGAWRIRYKEDTMTWQRTCVLKKLKRDGSVVRLFESETTKQILGKSLGVERPARKPRNIWEDEVRKDAAKLFHTKTGMTGGSELGMPWPGNGPRCHRRKIQSYRN